MLALSDIDISIGGLQRHYGAGDFSPRELVAAILSACQQENDNPVWIRLLSLEELEPYLSFLDAASPERSTLPIPSGRPCRGSRDSQRWA